MTRPSLRALDTGFRDRYFSNAEIEGQLYAWASAYPDLVRVESIGRTPERREILVLTIGPQPDRLRPGFWIDGNMHAVELCGAQVSLAMAEAVLALHVGEPGPLDALSTDARAACRHALVYVCPRISPDGADDILHTGRYIRSVPRDERPGHAGPRWITGDIDGDGLALLMRRRDPAGEFVEDKGRPGVMHLRTLDDEGPFYRIWPEGHVEGYDGHHVPEPKYLHDNYPDLNRNFPWDWRPENVQAGAGDYPGSEPESRAIIEFARRHPTLFAWVNLHTYGGVGIRPMGDAPDAKMHPFDLAVFHEVSDLCVRHTGYEMVSGFEEFTYAPETPLRGDMSEWAYHQLGCIAFVVELWDLFVRIGQPRPKRFVDRYNRLTREERLRLADWDLAENQGRIFRPWRAYTHPQLGDVEVGGFDPRFGMWNPPPEHLREVCGKMVSFFGRVLAMSPRLVASAVAEPLAEGLSRVLVTVENDGYLATCGLPSAIGSPVDAPIAVKCHGVEVIGDAEVLVGHLDGWGRGLHDGTDAPSFPRSRGTSNRRVVPFVVKGPGVARIRVGGSRTGFVDVEISV